jgi:hypothetical protein
LTPDAKHELVTAGFGQWKKADHVATAVADEGTLAVVYLPGSGTVQVAMSRFRGPVEGLWFDPTSGQFKSVEGSPFDNKGQRDFASPGKNSAGASDWALLLQTSTRD